MKKTISILFASLSISGFSQEIRILQGNTDVTGKTVVESILADVGYHETPFKLYNNSNQQKKLVVQRILKRKLPPGYFIAFTIAEHQPPPSEDSLYTTSDINMNIEIDAYGYIPKSPSMMGLVAIVGTGPVCEDYMVRYRIWAAGIPGDTSEVNIHYACTTGIDENEAGTFSVAFPNPASSIATIEYQLRDVSKSMYLQLHDLSGKLIKEVAVDQSERSIAINVTGLDSGFYFYSFMRSGYTLHTGKLIVNSD